MASCAGTPDVNPMVKRARTAYDEIEQDSLVIQNAPEQREEARQAVNEVVAAITNNEDQATVERKLQLAEQRIRIAQTVAELRAAQKEVERRSSQLRTLRERLKKIEREAVAAGQITLPIEEEAQQLIFFNARQTERGLILRFRNIRFTSEKATLMSNAEPPINELADFLKLYSRRTVLIEGHTDNTGAERFNQKLSEERANVVRDALISRGIAPARIRAVGLGEAYPIARNDTEAGRAMNRRVEVVISDENGQIPERQ